MRTRPRYGNATGEEFVVQPDGTLRATNNNRFNLDGSNIMPGINNTRPVNVPPQDGAQAAEQGVITSFRFKVNTKNVNRPVTIAILRGYLDDRAINPGSIMAETILLQGGILASSVAPGLATVQDTSTVSHQVITVDGATNVDYLTMNSIVSSINVDRYNSIIRRNKEPLAQFGVYCDSLLFTGIENIDRGMSQTNTIEMSSVNRKYSIENFLDFVQSIPVQDIRRDGLNVTGFTITSDDSLGDYNGDMELGWVSPFNQEATTRINLEDLFSVDQFQDKKIIAQIKTQFVINKFSYWLWTIPENREIALSIFFRDPFAS